MGEFIGLGIGWLIEKSIRVVYRVGIWCTFLLGWVNLLNELGGQFIGLGIEWAKYIGLGTG